VADRSSPRVDDDVRRFETAWSIISAANEADPLDRATLLTHELDGLLELVEEDPLGVMLTVAYIADVAVSVADQLAKVVHPGCSHDDLVRWSRAQLFHHLSRSAAANGVTLDLPASA
jgi:hypothetical protein